MQHHWEKKKKWSGGERAADGSIWYLDTRQESVKNHPVHSGSSSEPQQPLHREKIRDLREGMEKKRGWEPGKSPASLCWFPYGFLRLKIRAAAGDPTISRENLGVVLRSLIAKNNRLIQGKTAFLLGFGIILFYFTFLRQHQINVNQSYRKGDLSATRVFCTPGVHIGWTPLQPGVDQLSQNIPHLGDLGGFMFNGVYSLAVKKHSWFKFQEFTRGLEYLGSYS